MIWKFPEVIILSLRVINLYAGRNRSRWRALSASPRRSLPQGHIRSPLKGRGPARGVESARVQPAVALRRSLRLAGRAPPRAFRPRRSCESRPGARQGWMRTSLNAIVLSDDCLSRARWREDKPGAAPRMPLSVWGLLRFAALATSTCGCPHGASKTFPAHGRPPSGAVAIHVPTTREAQVGSAGGPNPSFRRNQDSR